MSSVPAKPRCTPPVPRNLIPAIRDAASVPPTVVEPSALHNADGHVARPGPAGRGACLSEPLEHGGRAPRRSWDPGFAVW